MDLHQVIWFLEVFMIFIVVSFSIFYVNLFSFITTNIIYLYEMLLVIGLILLLNNVFNTKSKSQDKATFIGENLKKLFFVIFLGYISKQILSKDIIEFASNFYKFFPVLFLLFLAFYVIDRFLLYRFTKQKINENYYKFFYYLILVYLSIVITVNKSNILNTSNIIIWLLYFNSLTVFNRNKEDCFTLDEISDVPISNKEQLFKSRQQELECIKEYIRENKYSESFAISISGEWGEGKSSLLNALKKEIDNDYKFIISIQPLIVDSRESLVKYFYDSMESLFRSYGIYTGKGSPLKEYFDYITNIIGRSHKLVFDKLIDSLSEKVKDYREVKKELQRDITKLIDISDSRIIVLIDDFDRIDEQVSFIILSFIKEIVDFKGCMVIFLMDYQQLKNTKISYEYLDKFINKRFDLKKLNKEEIIVYFLNKYLNIEDEFSKSILKKQLFILRTQIYTYFDDIFNSIKKMNDNYQKSIEELNKSSENQQQVKEISETIGKIDNFTEKLKNTTCNPRKIKKLLREIRDTFKYIDIFYRNYSDEKLNSFFESINCNKIIFKMVFIKVFIENEYDKIIDFLSLKEYFDKIRNQPLNLKTPENLILSRIFYDISEDLIIMEQEKIIKEKTIDFIDNIFINNYNFESLLDLETEFQKSLEVLDSGNINFKDNYYENIVNLYNVVFRNKWEAEKKTTQERINRIINYIFKEVDKDNLKLWDLINLINPDRRALYIDINYLRRLKHYLLHRKLDYVNEKDKVTNVYTLNITRQEVFSNNKHFLAFLLELTNIRDKKYNNISNEFQRLNNLVDFNNFAQKTLNISEDDSNELDKFRNWTNRCIILIKEIGDYDKYLDISVLQSRANELLETLSLLESIDKTVKSISIKKEFLNMEFRGGETYDELKVILERFKCYLEEDNINISPNIYSVFRQLLIFFEKISQRDALDDEVIQMLDEVYNILKKQLDDKFLDILTWEFCGSKMIEIKINRNKLFGN